MNEDIAAGQTVLGTFVPTQLFAGEAPITTNDYEIAAGVTVVKYGVYALDATGKVIVYDPAGVAPAITPRVIASQPAAAGDRISFFDGGNFNHEALVWPVSLTTFEARRAAFGSSNSTIKIGRLVG